MLKQIIMGEFLMSGEHQNTYANRSGNHSSCASSAIMLEAETSRLGVGGSVHRTMYSRKTRAVQRSSVPIEPEDGDA
jgi:hypothetical protein